ncbi:MAG: hypothetical protein MSS81_04790 [Clostridiales bacterium]|nr:hypothetical protein [Clostridiales bacterium]
MVAKLSPSSTYRELIRLISSVVKLQAMALAKAVIAAVSSQEFISSHLL